MIKISIPATTANMGCGFDTFGMALKIYNEVWIEEKNDGIETVEQGQPSEVPIEDNLIYTSLVNTLDKYDYKYKGFKIDIRTSNIPISRGLGSSAACIVAGITAASVLMGNKLSTDDIIREAVATEGHPDNIVPAVTGGMVVSLMQDNGEVMYSTVNIPENLRMFVMIPNFKLSTESSRGVLPSNYTREECVFNISRAALMVNAMNNGELEKLREATKDKIHQDYRIGSIKDAEKVFNMCEKNGSLAEFISGSGSTLMALVHKDNIDFEKNMIQFLDTLEDKWETHLVQPDFEGVTLV